MTMRDVKASGIYFVLYELLSGDTKDNLSAVSAIRIIFAGGLAGVLSWSAIIYLDVVKSRIQADCLVNPRYNGTVDTFRKCYQEGGIRVFGRGWTVMALRAFPVNGATFLVYEYCLALLKK